MLSCTFFGHRDAPMEIHETLKDAVLHLIENEGVKTFYVGNNGNFDRMAVFVLEEVKEWYKDVNCSIVLERLPLSSELRYNCETLFPEEMEQIHPKYAIDRRNRWMIERADFVITYVRRNFGGAARFKQMAQRKGKTIIELHSK